MMRHTKLRRVAALGLAMLLALSLVACGGRESSGAQDGGQQGSSGKLDTVKNQDTDATLGDTANEWQGYSDAAQAAIDELLARRQWEQYLAVAYIGCREEGDTTELTAWMHNEVPALVAFWPFLTEIPAEDIIGDYGYLYCVVPLEESIPFTVKSVEWEYLGNGATPYYSDPLRECEVGKPLLLYTACETWLDDFDVVLEYEEDYVKIWHPCMELDGETISGGDMILDFTYIYDVGDYIPRLNDGLAPDSEWLPPTELGLADTTWYSDNGWVLELSYDANADNVAGDMVLYQPVEGEDGTFLSPYYEGSWWMDDDSLCLEVYYGHCPFPLLISPSGEQLVIMQSDDGSVLPFFEKGQTTVGMTLSYG